MNFSEDTTGELVHKFVTLRDKIDEADKRHKEKTKDAREMLKVLEMVLLDRLKAEDGNSFASNFGTVYRTKRPSATIADGEAFRRYVIDNAAWDLIDIRANAPATAAYLEENSALPPGINYSVTYTVGVRRPAKK